jgi:DNA-directed RNA polymerase subunit M/transcription elongation factor TFIIS
MENENNENVDALCPECGHAFKAFVDRIVRDADEDKTAVQSINCPVCGCGDCRIEK